MSTLRIVQLVNTLAHADGGPARNSFELNLAFNSLPHTVAALVWMRGSTKATVASDFAAQGGTLPPIPPRKLGFRRPGGGSIAWLDLFRLVQSADAVVIHGYFLAWVPLFALLARGLGKPVFLMPHGALTPHELRIGARKKRLFRRAFRFAIGNDSMTIVTGSETERDDISVIESEVPVKWAGVGTRPPIHRPQPRDLSAPIRLLTMSRLAPKKRVDLAIRAVAILRERGLDVALHIAGEGPSVVVDQLREIARELGVTDRVHLHGLVTGPAKEELLFSSDVFLLPSEDENFGIAVAEATAHGLLVVASDRVAAAAMLSARVASLTSELNPSSIADAVEKTIGSYVPECRSLASTEAANSYSWTAVAGRWRGIIAEELSTRSPGIAP